MAIFYLLCYIVTSTRYGVSLYFIFIFFILSLTIKRRKRVASHRRWQLRTPLRPGYHSRQLTPFHTCFSDIDYRPENRQ